MSSLEYLIIKVQVEHPDGSKASYSGPMTGFLQWLMDCQVIKQETIDKDFWPVDKTIVHKNLIDWTKHEA